MIAQRFAQANIEFQKPVGWTDEQCYALWGFHGEIPGFKGNYADERRTPVVVSCWKPTDAERVRIAAGEPIYISIVGERQPPIVVAVDNPWGE
jgi:hypothetical protein